MSFDLLSIKCDLTLQQSLPVIGRPAVRWNPKLAIHVSLHKAKAVQLKSEPVISFSSTATHNPQKIFPRSYITADDKPEQKILQTEQDSHHMQEAKTKQALQAYK